MSGPGQAATATAGLGATQGSQAQFNSLLNILTKILETLQSGSGSSLYTVTPFVGTSPYTVSGATGTFSVRPSAPAPSTVNLIAGGPYLIMDGAGNASGNNITIVPPMGYTIRNAANYVISADWGSVLLVPDGQNFLTLVSA